MSWLDLYCAMVAIGGFISMVLGFAFLCWLFSETDAGIWLFGIGMAICVVTFLFWLMTLGQR